PDLILLDLQMPRMDGREVLQALAERGVDIPVVLMTFHGSEEIAIEVYRLGVKDYVKKPYSVDEMLNAIERSLSEARLRKEKDALVERMIQANRELQQRVQELNILYRIGKSVTSTVKLNDLLPQIVDAAIQVTHAEGGSLFLLEGKTLICRAEKRGNMARPENVHRESDDPAALHVVHSGKEIIAAREQFGDYPDSPHSAAYAPLMMRDRVIGVLGVSNYTPSADAFHKNDVALLSALTDYAAIAVDNSSNFLALQEAGAREKEQIRGTFERFVAPSVVEKVLTSPDDVRVGGTREEITVLFADIRGYTAWSEKESPEKVVEMLNDYLSLAAELVMAWEGTLDKFFGDGLMAIFNAPEKQAHHAHRAVDAALALLKAAEDMNRQKGYGLSYSVGVNVGEAVVGYVGTDRAMNYTAIGDVINIAKRLQERAAPGQILVTDRVIHKIGGLVDGQKLGDMKIRNRQNSVSVYKVKGLDPLA
ncbi:MAG: adenylate/guanylate cyclase domain-containing protein, partial [Chloroflexota bacterium]